MMTMIKLLMVLMAGVMIMKYDDNTDTIFVRRNITLGIYMVIIYHVFIMVGIKIS